MEGAYQFCLALRDDGTVIGKQVLDTGSVQNMTADKAGRRIVPIPLHKQPLIEGAGGGVLRGTHWVHRGVPPAVAALLPVGAPDELRFLWGPAFRFDICSTRELHAIGISTVACAATGRAYLFPAGADYRQPDRRVTCDTAEGLWTVPGDWCHRAPTVALPHVPLRRSPRGTHRGTSSTPATRRPMATSPRTAPPQRSRRPGPTGGPVAATTNGGLSDAETGDDGDTTDDDDPANADGAQRHDGRPNDDSDGDTSGEDGQPRGGSALGHSRRSGDEDGPPNPGGDDVSGQPDPADDDTRGRGDNGDPGRSSDRPGHHDGDHRQPGPGGDLQSSPTNGGPATVGDDGARDPHDGGAPGHPGDRQPHSRSRTAPNAGRVARAARSQRAAARAAAQIADAAAGASAASGAGAGHPAPTRRPQLSPIDYGEARLLLGNPNHRDTITILRRAGRRPVHVDSSRPQLDQLRAHAGQMAQGMTHVPPTGLERQSGETTWADTLGGKFPRSKGGNQWIITWSFSSRPHQTYCSFSDDHSAAATWAGFRAVCRQAGIPVLEHAVSQGIEVVTDLGKEFLGVFDANIQRAGILHTASSAFKIKKHSAQRGELVNRNLGRGIRGALVAARANFESAGHDGRDYWDYCAQSACRTIATRRRALAGTTGSDATPGDAAATDGPNATSPLSWQQSALAGTTGSDATPGDAAATAGPNATSPLSWQQIVRRNIAPFGARGCVTIQAKDPQRSKPIQLADNAKTGLFLGLTDNGKSRMLLPTGQAYTTSDVTFPVGAMCPVSGPVAFHDTEAWLEPMEEMNVGATMVGLSQRNSQTASDSGPTAPPASHDHHEVTHAAGPCSVTDLTDIDPAGAPDHGPERSGARPAPLGEGIPDESPESPIASEFSTIAGDFAPPAKIANQANSVKGPPANSGVTSDGAVRPGTTTASVGGATPAANPPGAPTPTPPDPSAPADDQYSFTDCSGAKIRVGDEITVERITGNIGSHRRTSHRGTVQTISPDADEYCVAYANGDTEWHPIDRSGRGPALRRTLVSRSFHRGSHRPRDRHIITLAARRPEPRAEVRFALGPDGNILRGCWDGTLTLPPEPALPHAPPEDAPPCPESVFQALAHEYALYWLYAAVRERRGHLAPVNRPPTYHFTRQRPAGRRLMTKWVFTIKRHADGSIDRFKARECIAGWHLRRGIDYTESYSGMTPWSDVLDLESLAALLGLSIWEADLTQAYAFAAMPSTPSGEPVIAVSCPGAQVHDADGVLLHQQADQAWYGHPSAGYALASHLHGALTGVNPPPGAEVCPVPFVQSPFQPCMFQAKYPAGHARHGELFILHVSTDNLRTYGSDPSIQVDFLSWLRRQFDVTGGVASLRDQPPQKFMGCVFTYQPDGSVTVDMPRYIDGLLHEVGMRDANSVSTPMTKGFIVSLQDSPTTPAAQRAVINYVNTTFGRKYTLYAEVVSFYGHLISSIGWITHRVGPIMQHAHSVLCRVLSAPSIPGFQGVKRLLRYLAGKTDMHRTYRPGRVYDWRNGDLPAWIIASDASYADDPHDRRGQGGYVGGFEGQAATTSTSKKTRRTCTSVDQAESDFAGSACKEAEYKRHWMDFFGILKPGPTKLSVDNFATVSRAGAPIRKWSPNSKQHDINEKYVVECVERGVIRVEHRPGTLPDDPRPGEGFPPDAMTKALPRLATEFYYDEIHGRRLLPPGARTAVDGVSLCAITSPVHSRRSKFCGMVGVKYADGSRCHVYPERIALYRGQE